MSVTRVDSSYFVPQTQREIKQELDKEAFLRLLVTQLANQDPTNPMDDRDFMAQMAQFSALEQMVNMTKSIEQMTNTHAISNQTLAASYIGRLVAFYLESDDPTLPPIEMAALVKAVWFDPNEGIILETDKGDIKLEQVIGVG